MTRIILFHLNSFHETNKLFYYNHGAIDGLMKKGYKQHRYKGLEVAKAVLKFKH